MTNSGNLFIFEHNPFNPLTQFIVRTCKVDADAILLSINKCKKLLSKAGFQLINSRCTVIVPPYVPFSGFINKYLTVLPIGTQYYVSATQCR